MKTIPSLLLISVSCFICAAGIAQSDADLSRVLSQYNVPTAGSSSATVDAELAQRMFRRGNTYSNLERFEDAIAEYRQAIAADPNFGEAMRTLANIYYFQGRYQEAKPLLARFITMSMQTETTAPLIASISTLGEMERKDGNYAISIALDLKSIALDPNNDSQVHIMANTYNNAGDADKAIQIYRAGIVAMPGNAFYYRTLGRLLDQEGRMEEALALYEQAAQVNPDSPFYADLVTATKAKLGRE